MHHHVAIGRGNIGHASGQSYGHRGDRRMDIQRKVPIRTEFTKRPGWGKVGTPIQVLSNYFCLKSGCKCVYMYAIDISSGFMKGPKFMPKLGPEAHKMSKLTSELNRKLISILFEANNSSQKLFYDDGSQTEILPAYDGVNTLFTTKQLRGLDDKYANGYRQVVNVGGDIKEMHYAITVKFTSTVNMAAMNAYRDGQLSVHVYILCADLIKLQVNFTKCLITH